MPKDNRPSPDTMTNEEINRERSTHDYSDGTRSLDLDREQSIRSNADRNESGWSWDKDYKRSSDK